MSGKEIIGTQKLVRRVVMAPHVQDYAIRLTMASHPGGPYAVDITNRYVRWGVSPRAVQTLTLGAKLHALLDGRYNTAFSDVQKVFLPAMRHRVLLNFEGEAEGISTDDVLKEMLRQDTDDIRGGGVGGRTAAHRQSAMRRPNATCPQSSNHWPTNCWIPSSGRSWTSSR